MPRKIRQHAGHHGLADAHRADATLGKRGAIGHDIGVVAGAIHGLARRKDRRGRLHSNQRAPPPAGPVESAEQAARLVGQKSRAVMQVSI